MLFVSLRTPTLLVTENNYFNVTIHLKNDGDDSYNTSLIMFYPPGLSFSRMTLIKVTIKIHYKTIQFYLNSTFKKAHQRASQ